MGNKLYKSRILISSSICIIGITALFLKQILLTNSKETSANLQYYEIIRNKNPINIYNILETNTSSKIEEEMQIEEIDIEFTTEYRNNANLPTGTIQVIQEGRDGRQNAVIIKKYQNNELISEELVAENLIKAAINKIVEIGTGPGVNNYIPKVGDKVYVTSSLLAVRLEPNSKSEKLATLKKGFEVEIAKIEGDWLYILSKENNGYIAANCITNINPNNPNSYITDDNIQNIQRLDFNMNLNVPSGFTLDEFKKVLSGHAQDKNGIFAENAEYFYYAEKQYSINGIFLASVAIHESGFGTSKISLDKKNLFGYGAVDSNPYGGAYSFNTYAEGIDLLARVFKKYYLNPEGTIIYDGNVANGKFYNGNTLSGVNIKYASDKNWANSVYKWMQQLYKK